MPFEAAEPDVDDADGGGCFVADGKFSYPGGCTAAAAVNWSLPSGYKYTKLPAAQVKSSVLANAGTGKI